jgi:NAD(P)-dependent dehydrogenase (short-subunit alcohol dehydrogenase family)
VEFFQGKVAVVTGAARGIGRAVAVELGRRGAQVVICGRSTAATPNKMLTGTLEECAEEVTATGAEVLTVGANLAVAAEVEPVAAQTLERVGRCDLLVNNAASTFPGGFLALPPKRWRTVWDVNVMAPVLLAHALLPGMLERGNGRILNLSSMTVLRNWPVLQSPYAVTKAGLETMTSALSEELTGTGVTINCIRIDEVVLTDVVEALGGADAVTAAQYDARTFARAMLWLLEQPIELSGQVLDFAALRARGALPAAGVGAPAV